MKVLITGSKGRIGKVLTPALSDSFEVYELDIIVEEAQRYYKANISSLTQLRSAFKQIEHLDCIVHLAAEHGVKADWQSVLKNNIIGTKNVYECARAYGIEKVIFASSNHVTGGYEGEENPKIISIKDPIRPDSYYGASKAFGEALARQYLELYGIKSICLRIGSFLEGDDPTKNERFMKTWISHRDLIQLIKKSILSDVDFGIYYGVSNNKGRFWDISNAEKELGYKPQDDSSLKKSF